jgi:DNA-binding NarL/FixJ family response regulator
MNAELNRYKASRNRKPKNTERNTEIIGLREQGMTVANIAKKFNLKPATVRKIIYRHRKLREEQRHGTD